MSTVILYGIKNCDTVKKARQWLAERQISYSFHDYQVQGISLSQLQKWVQELGWQSLLNTRGTTWRQLAPEQKLDLNEQRAIELMLHKTSLIKRPILDLGFKRVLGFNPADYDKLWE